MTNCERNVEHSQDSASGSSQRSLIDGNDRSLGRHRGLVLDGSSSVASSSRSRRSFDYSHCDRIPRRRQVDLPARLAAHSIRSGGGTRSKMWLMSNNPLAAACSVVSDRHSLPRAELKTIDALEAASELTASSRAWTE